MLNKLDRPFLEKMTVGQTYHIDYDSYISSVVDEMGNILSCRLRGNAGVSKNPFGYGIKDWLSQEISKDGLDMFRISCQRIIKELDSRISDIEITDIKINNKKQSLQLEVMCILRPNNRKIYKKMIIS